MDHRDIGGHPSSSNVGHIERPLPAIPGQNDDEFQASILPRFRPHTIAETNLTKNQARSITASDTNGNGSSSSMLSLPPRSSSRSPNTNSAQEASQQSPNDNVVAPTRSRASTHQSVRRTTRSPGDNDSLSSGDMPLLSHTSPSHSRRRERERERERTPEPVEVIVPPWQLDASVTICPICRTQFSFFVRKHHCRKCGRVVCNSCSPHRITIPYQYIVQPPSESGTTSGTRRSTLDSARAGSSAAVEGLGGGERVRLCNPCVPDPNIAPPQAPLSPNQTPHSQSVSMVSPSYPGPYRPTSAFDAAVANFPRRSRQASTHTNPNRTSRSNTSTREAPLNNDLLRPDGSESRSRSSTIGAPRDALTMGQFLGTFSVPNSLDQSQDSQPSRHQQQHYRSLIPPSNDRPLPQALRAPRRPIPEEDECWVCHRELPSKTLENFETLRANHVQACVAEAMGQTSPSPALVSAPSASASPTLRSPRLFVGESSASAIAQAQPLTTSNTPEARMAAREQPHAAVVLGHSQGPSSPGRRTGVFPYHATEKDCVDDAECTICLEEFEVGVEMGRLECFCRFHLKCIRGWFENRPGQCPVHQHGGGY